jgi:hypothetical protein
MAYATVEQLAVELRIKLVEGDRPRLQACLDAAGQEIDHYVNRFVDDPIPEGDPLAERVCLMRGLEWAKANDAAFGAIGFADSGVLTAPRDQFARWGRTLIPLKQQFGVA